jgi:flagellin-like protein
MQYKEIIHCPAHRGHAYQVFETMKFTKNDEAVSPVIGVILMVAITVILAAVIAAFVFGMAGNIQKTKVVAATAQQKGPTSIDITYAGGQDARDVSSLKWVVGDNVDSGVIANPSVGTIGHTGVGTSAQDHVVVSARFSDGSEQVILDSYV